MAFNDLTDNQMVTYANAQSGPFVLKSGQSNTGTNQCMTKDIAFAMYDLSTTSGSNGIAGNQLMQKSFWVALANTKLMPSYLGNGLLAIGSTSVNIPYPSGIISGDLMVMQVLMIGTGSSITPSGWTKFFDTNIGPDNAIYQKFASGSESGTVNVIGDGTSMVGIIYNFRNVSSNGIVVLQSYQNSSNTITIPGTYSTPYSQILVADLFLYRGYSNLSSSNLSSGWVARESRTVTSDGVPPQPGSSSGATSYTATKEMPTASTQPGQVSIAMNTTYTSSGFAIYLEGSLAPDTTAPIAPTNLAASNIAETSLTLTWSASTDNVAVTNYLVYKNGNLLATLGNVLTYNVTGLNSSTSYIFTVYAKDAAGNVSTVSNTVNATTSVATTYTWIFNSTGQANDANACGTSGTGLTLYSNTSTLNVNDILYNDAARTNAFNGGALFRKCTTGTATGFVFQIDTVGVITSKIDCGIA